jgi:hypothetical protein
MPAVTRALHNPNPQRRFVGRAQIRRGGSPLARLIASWLGLPHPGDGVPVQVTVRRDGAHEVLTRDYGGEIFETRQFQAETDQGKRLMETIGPITTRLRVEARHDGLNLHAEQAFWRGVPLPRWLTPRVRACERAYGGAHLFDVSVRLPLIGQIIAYRGRLVERD